MCSARFPSRIDALKATALGALFFGPSHVLYYFAMGHTSTFEGNVLGTTAPLWVAVLSFIFLREKIQPNRLVGILLGFVGAYIVSVGFAIPNLEDGHTYGNTLYLGAVVMEAVCGVLVIEVARRSSGITALWFQVLGAAIALILGSLFLPAVFPFRLDTVGLPTVGVLTYLTLVSGLFTFGVWYTLAEKAPLNLMVITLLLQPPLATALGVYFLNERPAPHAITGTLIIFAALGVGLRSRNSRLSLRQEVSGS